MSDTAIIDPQAIKNLRDLNSGEEDEFLHEIIGIFLEDTPQRIAELDLSLAMHDAKTFARSAHSIKGSASNLGAIQLRSVAESLEQLSRKGGLVEVSALVDAVKNEFARAQVELTKLLPAR